MVVSGKERSGAETDRSDTTKGPPSPRGGGVEGGLQRKSVRLRFLEIGPSPI